MKNFLFCTTLLLMSVLTMNAQETEKKNPFYASVELTSKYLWRGQEYGEAPTIFPTLGANLGYGFSVYATGAYTFDNSWREADLGICYSYKDFTIGVLDYYYPTPTGEDDKFFEYSSHGTGHLFEGNITYAPSNIPVSAMISTFFFGADKKENGKQAWSTYAELGYHYDINETNIFSVAIGASLNKSMYNNYETGFSVVNIAFKYQTAIPIKGKFSMPVSAQYVINPQKEKSYLSFSIGLSI